MTPRKKSWTVYILECVDGTLYTGVTNDLPKRLLAHNSGTLGAKYTKARRPVVVRYKERAKNRSAAQTREAEIKGLSRKEKLRLIARS